MISEGVQGAVTRPLAEDVRVTHMLYVVDLAR